MTNFIPIFPLGLVVFPGEILHLKIFEPRYKQLINECYEENKSFGIPTVLNQSVTEIGTLVDIIEIVKLYPDGKMDIRTKGVRIFRILELVKDIPDKLYSGAIVIYPKNNEIDHKKLKEEVLAFIRKLHVLLNVTKHFSKPDKALTSYDIAHHAGLSIHEEYEFLGLIYEVQRLEFLKRFLRNVMPLMVGMEKLKEKIHLNGHFKELKGFNFNN